MACTQRERDRMRVPSPLLAMHESQSASCLVEETSTLLCDPTVTARRKRREIRLFKKFAFAPASTRGLNLIHQGVLKRASSRPLRFNSLYLFDGGVNEEDDGGIPDLCSRLSEEQGLSELVRSGLARSRSYPPEGWQTSKCIFQISKIRCPSSEKGLHSLVTVVKDDSLASAADTPSAPCATDIEHASPEVNRQSAQVDNSLQTACASADQVSVPDEMSIDKVLQDKDAGVKIFDDEPQAASNMTPKAVTNGLNLAGKTALLQNVEGSLPISLAETRLEVNQASSRPYPPSAKVLICGRRREMEDTAVIVPTFARVPRDAISNGVMDGPLIDLHFYGVYDGHGGSQASNYCAKRLHHALAEEIASCSMTGDSSNSREWQRVMSSCFMKVDKEVGGVCPYGACDDVDSSAGCCVGSIAPENAGTTAVVAVVSSSQIILANCGDSRAVLSRGGKAIPLSLDHKPERADETSRIEAAGGRVIAWKGFRVGALLALSRAIGDRYLKRYVISEPDVACLQRTEEDECLILASDGLWDVFDNETACDVARRCLASSRGSHEGRVTSQGDDYASASAAATLVKLACGKGSQDNISVVVIDLSNRKK